MRTGPRLVFTIKHLPPCGKNQTRDIAIAAFDAEAMLRLVRAGDFDLDRSRAAA